MGENPPFDNRWRNGDENYKEDVVMTSRSIVNIVSRLAFTAVLVTACIHSAHAVNTVQEVVDDMKLNHEAAPHGVPSWWSWGTKGRIGHGQTVPAAATHISFWNQVYEPTTLNPSVNARVQMRDAQVWVLYNDNKWYRLQNAEDFGGWAYKEDFSASMSTQDRRDEDPGFSVRAGCKSSVGCGTIYHGWVDGLAWFDKSRLRGWFVTCEARLIGDSTGKYLLGVGADYRDGNWGNYYDVGIGRLKWVTTYWRSFNMHTLTEDQLRNNPPPLQTGPPYGETIAIKASNNGKFVLANLGDSNARLQATATAVGAWEKFRVDNAGGGKIALFSLANSKYVIADDYHSNKLLRSIGAGIGSWQSFYWSRLGGNKFALRSQITDKYVTNNPNLGNVLVANAATTIGGWEEFTYSRQ
jgi:hypothetical protein